MELNKIEAGEVKHKDPMLDPNNQAAQDLIAEQIRKFKKGNTFDDIGFYKAMSK